MEKERIEAMECILSDMGITLSEDQIKELTQAFCTHLELEREMQSYQFVGHKEKCSECEVLKSKLSAVTKERDVYHNSVCKRRKTEDVWIECDTVMFK